MSTQVSEQHLLSEKAKQSLIYEKRAQNKERRREENKRTERKKKG